MAYKINGTTLVIDPAIPYLWGSGDTTTTPSNETKVTASDAAADDFFGRSVAVGLGKIVVGSNNEAVYVYDLDGSNEIKITASDGAAGNRFGISVAIGSGKIVVGASGNSSNSGAAYIYDLDGSNETKITASDAAANDFFGNLVAIGCGKIAVGSDFINEGAVYIYDLDGTNETKITSSDNSSVDRFGYSLSIGSGRIVVGSPHNSEAASLAGAVYVYDLNGANEIKITASDADIDDTFGESVAVGSGKIVVGAWRDDDNGSFSGSAYIYDLDGSNEIKITASDGAAGDDFGKSVAVGNGRIVIGASRDNDNGTWSGSAYVFDLNGTQLAKLTASDGASGDNFGGDVAIGSGKIVVCASGDNSNTGAGYIYNTPNVYTVWDAIDLNYGD